VWTCQRMGSHTLTDLTFLAPLRVIIGILRKIVLSLGSLHLTLMAVIGIWFWSSPTLFESRQPEHPEASSLYCTSTNVLGQTISLTSLPLRAVSLVIYSFFLIPGLNLLAPAALFLAAHIGYHRMRNRDNHAKLSILPIFAGLLFLLAINVVFLVNIETTIRQHQVDEEALWTFGQTLAVLLLVLPLRDVFSFITHVRKEKRHEKRRARCTEELKRALERGNMDMVMKVVKHADLRAEATGRPPPSHAANQG
jgi:hypothetical protein